MADYFLKIDGIVGESQDAKHPGEIELESFSWGETQQGLPGPRGGGGAAGKVQVEDFHFTMQASKASPQLLLACTSGQHLKSAAVTARKTGEDQQEFLVYTFSDLLISSYRTGATADQLPLDEVAFSFAQISVEYRPQKASGELDTPIHVAWDVRANRKL